MKHLFTTTLKKITGHFIFGFILLLPLDAFAAEGGKKADLDGDGYAETQLFYEGKNIVSAIIDENGDGKSDGVISYKNGFRDSGERDINFDGKTDTWIKYYITGVPWVVSRDKNSDGNVDYWKYIKNGFIYKREWDRNFDGKPDVRMIIPGKADLREGDEPRQTLEKQYDENFDGEFEKVMKVRKRMSQIRVQSSAGAIGEV